jgi:hypothetical protein
MVGEDAPEPWWKNAGPTEDTFVLSIGRRLDHALEQYAILYDVLVDKISFNLLLLRGGALNDSRNGT